MRRSVRDVPELVLNCPYSGLQALDLNWQGYLPLVHPLSLRVITIVHISCPVEPNYWICADVRNGQIVNVGHPSAKDVAVFRRALPVVK